MTTTKLNNLRKASVITALSVGMIATAGTLPAALDHSTARQTIQGEAPTATHTGGMGAPMAKAPQPLDDPATPPPAAAEVAPPPPPPAPPVTYGQQGPLDEEIVANGYGYRYGVNPLLPADYPELHNGIDFAAPMQTPIHAMAAGTVVYAQEHQYGGVRTVIDHGNGLQSTYNHQNAQWVQVGEQVTAGQIIGEVGSTGNSTGAHLHFEVLQDGEYVDPAPVLASVVPGQ